MAREEIVSNASEQLILVDDHDREIGYQGKADCHTGKGVLHRAFSIFVFNEGNELLLQQRSPSKMLWPGYWSNTCCSHPRRGEDRCGRSAGLEKVTPIRGHVARGRMSGHRLSLGPTRCQSLAEHRGSNALSFSVAQFSRKDDDN